MCKSLAYTKTFAIRQNIVISLGLKAVFLVTTIIGVTGLWPPILADTGATVLVTLNALRLLTTKSLAIRQSDRACVTTRRNTRMARLSLFFAVPFANECNIVYG